MHGVSGDLLSSGYLEALATDPRTAPSHPGAAWGRAVLRWRRRAAEALGPATAPRTLLDVGARPLLELLDLRPAHVESHPWGYGAVLTHQARPVATLVCAPWGTAPAAAWRQAMRSSLAVDLPWALVFNGAVLSVVEASRPWSRRHLTIDLAVASRDPRGQVLLWTLLAGQGLRGGPSGRLGRAIAASDAAGVAVCAALGGGVLEALDALTRELGADHTGRAGGHPDDRGVFDQSLTIVYRLLFLLFAEARGLVPMWHHLYRDAYSMDALCERLLDDPRAHGVWSTVQAMSRLAHAGCVVDDLRVTAFNGRLFAPGRTPLGESRRVADGAAARAVLALGTTASRAGRQRVAFHDLGVEQLGAVYERVLDYEPVRDGGRLALRPSSSERKTTGSFYTPRTMTDFLVRRTLAPLVEGRSADAILALRVLDPAMGSGAFLVAACRYLTERVERARIVDGSWTEADVTDADRAAAARQVAERCLYGMDRNATAVQLARLSLWLTTLAADRPLTFLDHHLAVGNSLIGARIADLPFPPSTAGPIRAPGQLPLFDDEAREAWGRAVVPERHRLALDPSDRPADVRAKEQRLERLWAAGTGSGDWARAGDLWCGLALQPGRVSPGVYAEMQQHIAGRPTALAASDLADRVNDAIAIARAHGAVHWDVLFPEVCLDAAGHPREDGGFDAIVGNPPWEVLRADTGTEADRTGAREGAAAAMRFIRASRHYPLHASGHVNQYQLFLERALQALAPGGRFGLILPSGLQTDVGSAGLRRALLDRTRIDTWITFDNRRAIFPIHRSVRFLLVAGTVGGPTAAIPIADGGGDAACLARLPDDPRADANAPVTVTRAFLERWDPAHLTVPWLNTPLAMRVTARALHAPPLADRAGWGVTFGRELNASDNRKDLVPAASGTTGYLPVVEGKHLRPFAVEVSAAAAAIAPARAASLLGRRWQRTRIGYRDVASSTNRLTLMAAVLPAGVLSTHTVFCSVEAMSDDDTWCLVGLLNSLVANYLVRLQMTTHVTATLMARLRVPRPRPGSGPHRDVADAARALSRCASIDDEPEGYAQLNADVAALYGLSSDEYAHVVSTFPLLGDTLRGRCLAAWSGPSAR